MALRWGVCVMRVNWINHGWLVLRCLVNFENLRRQRELERGYDDVGVDSLFRPVAGYTV